VSPTVRQLPAPPPGRKGWPWTTDLPLPFGGLVDNQTSPRVTVVTPSFNQGQFIEETLRSVLLQGYPNLEYIVIDGGSTDGSVDTIRRYEPWLSFWVSEKDRGQAHAINKGFERSTGSLLGWLNSDDILLPDALSRVAAASGRAPQAIILGDVMHISATGKPLQVVQQRNVTLRNIVEIWNQDRQITWQQPGTYVPRHHFAQVGGADENLRFVFDLDWMCRLLRVAPVTYLHSEIASFRLHPDSKTVGEAAAWLPEYYLVAERYIGDIPLADRPHARAALELVAAQVHLSVRYWNRQKALRSLARAMRDDWHVLQRPSTLPLLLRVTSPIQFLRMLQRLRKAGQSDSN
jgi:glycosyltransferase involved in cell wall biosynthesis